MVKTTSDNRIKRVLWTGGFDSTYRMIELALQDVIVEPVYVVNPGRRSRHIELSAMNKMLELLRGERKSSVDSESELADDEHCVGESSLVNDERCAGESSHDIDERYVSESELDGAVRFRAKIRDIRMFNKDDIVIPDNVHIAYERLHASHDIGPQYEWLSALAKTVGDLEICIEKAPTGRLHSRDVIIMAQESAGDARGSAADMQGSAEGAKDDTTNTQEPVAAAGIYAHIANEFNGVAGGNSTFRDDVETIFGDFILPVFDITEDEMIANIRKWDCEDIIKHIWFCNHPLRCGNGFVGGAQREKKEQGDVNVLCGEVEPCGICHPCRIKVESGMDELLPSSALGRYRRMKAIEVALGEDAAREYRMKVWVEFGIK